MMEEKEARNMAKSIRRRRRRRRRELSSLPESQVELEGEQLAFGRRIQS